MDDLADEIAEAKDDEPQLSLDRVWITSDGRVILLDFPLPLDYKTKTPQVLRPQAFLRRVASLALGERDESRCRRGRGGS